jgi:hypothetical protein
MLLIDLIRDLDPIKYKDVYQRTELAFNHYATYIYTGYLESDNSSPLGSMNNPPLLRHPTSVETRADFQPDVVLPLNARFASLYHAVTHKNGYALRILHIQFMQNLWWSLPLTYDNMVSALPLWNNFTDIIHHAYDDQYLDTTLLPSELSLISNTSQIIDTPNSAFVEITAGAAHIKYDQERLILNMNYRHGLNNISGIIRLLFHGRNISQIATIAFNTTDGFWGLWTMNYANYFVAINRNKNKSYDFNALKYNVQSRYVLDLISNKQYDLQTMPSIPTWTAWVWIPINKE